MTGSAEQPRPSSAHRGTDLGDEYLLFDSDGDLVHVLNGTAREIFLLCDGSRTEEEVVLVFAKQHETAETARDDAEQLIHQLYDRGLLQK